MSDDRMLVEPEQRELLGKLVRAHESLPRSERKDFRFSPAYVRAGARPRFFWEESIKSGSGMLWEGHIVTKKEDIPRNLDRDMVFHPALPNGGLETTQSDVDFLSEAELIRFRNDNQFFYITPVGFEFNRSLSSLGQSRRPLSLKAKEVVERLMDFRNHLLIIIDKARNEGDFVVAYERLRRCKERIVEYLREQVSEQEANNLKQTDLGTLTVGDHLNNLADEVSLYDGALKVLIEEIEDDALVLEAQSIKYSVVAAMQDTAITIDVFLSYSSDDRQHADELYEAITAAGGKAFLAARDLRPGDDFAEEIRKALWKSRELWLLVSPNSLTNDWVISEWGAAWALGKKIVPILILCRAEHLPDRIARLHCIDFHKFPELISDRFKNPQPS